MGIPEPLLASVCNELRRLAAYQLGSERRGHTLQATALVLEAYLRLAGQGGGQWHDRLHFIRVASETMRRVLVDHARSRLRNKRGGGVAHVSLSEAMELVDGREVEVLDLDRALNRLAEADPRKARLVELRYFAGLTMEECAEVLSASSATLERDWRFSRAFLRREIGSLGSV